MKIIPLLWIVIALLTASKIMDSMTIKQQRQSLAHYARKDIAVDKCIEALEIAVDKLMEKE